MFGFDMMSGGSIPYFMQYPRRVSLHEQNPPAWVKRNLLAHAGVYPSGSRSASNVRVALG